MTGVAVCPCRRLTGVAGRQGVTAGSGEGMGTGMFVGSGEGTGMRVGVGAGVGSGHMITVRRWGHR